MVGFLHTGKFTGVLARLTQGAGKGGIIPCRKGYGGLGGILRNRWQDFGRLCRMVALQSQGTGGLLAEAREA